MKNIFLNQDAECYKRIPSDPVNSNREYRIENSIIPMAIQRIDPVRAKELVNLFSHTQTQVQNDDKKKSVQRKSKK